ncbi:hypothetical protein R1521_14775 [Rhizobium brockwellii]|uniref:JAB domain-containing protein n=1 Tax=Rhizobium brockwellii TaxID=3019932 RepID=A0ABU3YLI7_9HYPH|nr:hypothetical protein [Rhizobium brockwellii]MDV4179770.1 hypothetical protein [Rhizobium brockwellii]MDV4186692.1 hypothetical protein [Rhizobium brockwellii]
MSGNEPVEKRIQVSVWIWARLVLGLRIRGKGRRESGAFLLGHWTGQLGTVTRVVFYDQLDSHAYENGIIMFHGEGLATLWKICRNSGLEVIADSHTHGNMGTGQSVTDQRNPMIPEVGHTALIFPYFARMAPWSMRGVGVHEYLGNFKWRRHDKNGLSDRIRLTLW